MSEKTLFEDSTSEGKKIRGEIFFALFFGAIIGGVSGYLIGRIFVSSLAGLLLGLFGTILFSFILFKLGSGIKYKTNIKISDEGILFKKTNQFFGWKDIDRIELLKGKEIIRFPTLPTIAVIKGKNVNTSPIEASNKKLKEIKRILEGFVERVEIK